MTVKTRVTLLIVGAGLVSSLLFSIVVFLESIEQPFDILDSVLKEEAYRATRMILKSQKESDSLPPDFASHAMTGYWIEIYEQSAHKMLFRSDLAKSLRLAPVKLGSSANARVTLPPGQINPELGKSREITFRVRSFLIKFDGRPFVVQIARDMGKLEHEIWDMVFGIVAGLIFSILVLIRISRFMADKILQPIGEIKILAQDISEKNLDQRIPTGDGQDEFSELTRTINRMLDRLQFSIVRQRDLLFDTSHELKTPLTTMRLAVDKICTSGVEITPPFVKDNLLQLNNQVLRMDRIIKDLLNLSSLEILTSIDLKPVDLSALLSSLAGEYKFLADAHNITMEIRLPKQFVTQGNVDKLHRAFSNILDNAIKYNVDGGQILLTGNQSATKLTVTVSNTGLGVAESEIPKVFNQFYRVEKSRSIQHGGSGLGLTIVKRIVELHGGDVKFESQQGGWTQVTVSLPLTCTPQIGPICVNASQN
jgi:signal transduction histidine kinase